MKRGLHLLEIELLKARSIYAFGITILVQLVAFLALILIGANFDVQVQGVSVRPFFEFPHVWEIFAWLLGWLNVFTAFGLIVMAGSEFGDRMVPFQLVSGMKRYELVVSKILLAVAIALFWTIILLLATLGFGIYSSPEVSIADMALGMPVLLAYFLRTCALLLITLLVVFVVKNSALSILLFVILFSLAPIIHTFVPENIGWMFPFGAMQDLTPMPDFISLAVINHPELSAFKEAIAQPEVGTVSSMWYPFAATILYSAIFILALLGCVRRKSF